MLFQPELFFDNSGLNLFPFPEENNDKDKGSQADKKGKDVRLIIASQRFNFKAFSDGGGFITIMVDQLEAVAAGLKAANLFFDNSGFSDDSFSFLGPDRLIVSKDLFFEAERNREIIVKGKSERKVQGIARLEGGELRELDIKDKRDAAADLDDAVGNRLVLAIIDLDVKIIIADRSIRREEEVGGFRLFFKSAKVNCIRAGSNYLAVFFQPESNNNISLDISHAFHGIGEVQIIAGLDRGISADKLNIKRKDAVVVKT